MQHMLEDVQVAEHAFFASLAVISLIMMGHSLIPLFRSEQLTIDLLQRNYSGRRGLPFWGERLGGPLDDFEEIRLVDIPRISTISSGSLMWPREVVGQESVAPTSK
jgi:hypothetical protein